MPGTKGDSLHRNQACVMKLMEHLQGCLLTWCCCRIGVTVNAICPGWVLTPLVQRQIDDKAKALNISEEEAIAMLLGEKQPSQSFVTVEQIAALAVFLCSANGDQVRGVAWNMDGGWTAQ